MTRMKLVEWPVVRRERTLLTVLLILASSPCISAQHAGIAAANDEALFSLASQPTEFVQSPHGLKLAIRRWKPDKEGGNGVARAVVVVRFLRHF